MAGRSLRHGTSWGASWQSGRMPIVLPCHPLGSPASSRWSSALRRLDDVAVSAAESAACRRGRIGSVRAQDLCTRACAPRQHESPLLLYRSACCRDGCMAPWPAAPALPWLHPFLCRIVQASAAWLAGSPPNSGRSSMTDGGAGAVLRDPGTSEIPRLRSTLSRPVRRSYLDVVSNHWGAVRVGALMHCPLTGEQSGERSALLQASPSARAACRAARSRMYQGGVSS